MRTFRLHLPVLDTNETHEVLDLVTSVDGVVGALIDAASATLEVIVSKEASALHVREQLLGTAGGLATA